MTLLYMSVLYIGNFSFFKQKFHSTISHHKRKCLRKDAEINQCEKRQLFHAQCMSKKQKGQPTLQNPESAKVAARLALHGSRPLSILTSEVLAWCESVRINCASGFSSVQS